MTFPRPPRQRQPHRMKQFPSADIQLRLHRRNHLAESFRRARPSIKHQSRQQPNHITRRIPRHHIVRLNIIQYACRVIFKNQSQQIRELFAIRYLGPQQKRRPLAPFPPRRVIAASLNGAPPTRRQHLHHVRPAKRIHRNRLIVSRIFARAHGSAGISPAIFLCNTVSRQFSPARFASQQS